MGSRYQSRFSDFTYPIDRREFEFDRAVPLAAMSYGPAYMVPWKKARHYNQHGDVSYEWGAAMIRVLAESKGEHPFTRLTMFCQKVANLSIPQHGLI